MGIVTALEVQKRNKERVNVYLDDAYAFSLPMIEAVKLHKGQTLTDEDVAHLSDVDAVHRAVDQAVRFLSYRPRSVAEVRRNLEQKDIAETVIEAAIERLIHLGYLDDLAFARYWLENRTTFKPRGPMALRYELKQKGVTDDIISEVVDQLDVDAAAYQAAQQKAVRLRGLTRQKFRHKLGGFLQRRGFPYSTCNSIIEQLATELAEEDETFFIDNENDLMT